jgi:hypothetical protein
MNAKDGVRLIVGSVFIVVSSKQVVEGKAVNRDLANIAKMATTLLSTGDTGAISDGGVYFRNEVTQKEIRAFPPASRKPATEQST